MPRSEIEGVAEALLYGGRQRRGAGKPDPTPAIVDMLKTGSKDDHNKVVASDADLKAIAATVLASK